MPLTRINLPLTPSQVTVLFNILDEIIGVYHNDPGLDAYTRSTTDSIASFSSQEYDDIVSIRDNLI